MDIPICRQDEPPPSGPAIWIKRLKANERWCCRVCSDRIYGLWIHWHGKSSSPCIQPKECCAGCRAKWIRKWKGYVHVYDIHSGRVWFYELTPFTARQVKQQVSPDQLLHGLILDVTRGNGDKARCHLKVTEGMSPMPPCKRDVSPIGTLEELWKMQGVALQIYRPEELPDAESA